MLQGHTGDVWSLAVLSIEQVASGSSDRTVCLWDTAIGECKTVLEGHIGTVYPLVPLPSGQLASGHTIRPFNYGILTLAMNVEMC